MVCDAASVRTLLSRTPSVLCAMLEGLPTAWLDTPEEPGAWSPREVAAHLADLERDGWLPRVRMILDHGGARLLPDIERERFRARYGPAPIQLVMDELRRAREANLRALDALGLDDAALAATGRHSLFGDVRLSQLLSAWVVHDLTHVAQISRALASQYRDEVGPWIELLSILRRGRDEPGPTADASALSTDGRDGPATKRDAVTTDRIAEPVGPFSPAVRATPYLFLSGQVAQHPGTGSLVADGDVARQTEQIFENVGAVLRAAGRSFADVVRVGVFLTDMGDFHAMNEVYARRFEPPYPARTTLGVAALPLGARVEMEMIAR